MSKKIVLLAVTVISAAFFALPALAGAEEFAIDGTAEAIGHGTESFIRASGEPTITCETEHVSVTWTHGSTYSD